MQQTVKKATSRIDFQKLLAPIALVILYVFFSIFGKNFFPVQHWLASWTARIM